MFTRIVVPVSTRSTTASARPNPHAASTEPETYLMPRKKILKTGKDDNSRYQLLVGASALSKLSKNDLARFGNDVTILFPDKS